MAFTQKSFGPISSHGNSDMPNIWTYRTIDSSTDVTESNYFLSKISNIRSGDYFVLDCSDGAFTANATVTSSAIIVSLSGGLTQEQQATLSHLIYNPTTNTLDADRSIRTILSSLLLGGSFKLSAGADKVFTTNLLTNVDYFSPSSGIKDQSIIGNQGASGITGLSTPVLSDATLFLEANGPEDTSGAVSYEGTNIVPSDVAVFGIKFTFEEPIVNADFLIYEIFAGTDDTGKLIYQQLLSDLSLASGSTFEWDFTTPLFGTNGLQIYTRLSIAKGGEDEPKTTLQVRRSSTMTSRHWVESQFRSWINKDVALVEMLESKYVSSNQPIDLNGVRYAVDTTSSTVTLTVDVNLVRTFFVFDAYKQFDSNSCFIVIGLDTYELDKKEKEYEFSFDGTQWNWFETGKKVKT
ncbi:MAG: hypothetical protein HRU18_16725 [Pseudoalteromonas sp.]|uniref:hypothetical protein n=1 Tax=Pseudoalteromonas sp. TaxID=53249 RepID=UPI001DA41031|nr:hypothetical protein [Pseudoalteromonas sp.]NRA79851.1 hypothetical protein [Pseudoalteromonas sp.]